MQQNVFVMRKSYFVETKLVTNYVIEIFSMLNTQSTQLVCNAKHRDKCQVQVSAHTHLSEFHRGNF